MPKLKQQDSSGARLQLACSSTGSGAGSAGEQPASREPERKRAKLSFSIESIMQSARGDELAGLGSASPGSSERSLDCLADSPASGPKSDSCAESDATSDSRGSTPTSPGRAKPALEPNKCKRKLELGLGLGLAGVEQAAQPAAKKSAGSTNQLLRPQVCRDPRLAPFECQLDNLELWHRFHALETEMIITKQGR